MAEKSDRTGYPVLPGSPMEQALQRFEGLLPKKEFAFLLEELKKPLPPAIRANAIKTDPLQAIVRWADSYGWQTKSIPFCDTGWWVTKNEQPVSNPVEHRLGFYYIQDAASMLPVSLFDFQPGERPLILDMAASPGGKTTHLVDRSADLGLVVANDSSRERIKMLRLVLQNWGAMNIGVTRFPGEKFGTWFPEKFDVVLLDAPCSMQNLRSSEARPMHSISSSERDMLAARQERLLISALQAACTGGQVVYSTCTLNPEEDESVLDAVLRRYPGSLEIEDVSQRLTAPAPGLKHSLMDGREKQYAAQVQNAVRLWPHIFGTSGFFAALIRKVKPIACQVASPPSLDLSRSALRRYTDRETADFTDRLHQAYGFDFEPVLETQQLSLWRRKDVVYAIPEQWWQHFSGFPFQAVGMRVAEDAAGLVPSHEWVARFGLRFQHGIGFIPEDQVDAWLQGQDLHKDLRKQDRKGAILAMMDDEGRLYGRGKALSNRVRNLLPSRIVHFG